MTQLGERGAVDVTLGGNGKLPGARKRKPKTAEKIAARIAKFKDTYKPTREIKNGRDVGGTTPLNVGFFLLQRVRTESVTKARAKRRAKAKGK